MTDENSEMTDPGRPSALPKTVPASEIAAAMQQATTYGEATRLSEETLKEVPLEQLGHVLCRSTGITPDESFWCIAGIPRGLPHGLAHHAAVRYSIEALVFRKGGSFELFYQYTALVESLDQWSEHTMYSDADWSSWQRGSCEVTGPAAFDLQAWIPATQKAMDRARILHQAMLDDEGIARARADLLVANRLDHQTVAAQRLEVEKKNGIDDESIARERAAALIDGGLDDVGVAALRARLLKTQGLDDRTIEERRQKAYDEGAVEDSHLIRITGRVMQREGLDDASIAKRRAEILEKHGLA